MPFLTPLMLGLLGVLVPLVVLMYLLKLKRRPEKVPSTLLWRRSVQDLVANAPFQKLRNNLLLWLQLLILLLLIFALARPVMRMTGLGGETIILLVDLSASMNTREPDGETRMDKARRHALDAIDQMNVPSSILGFGARDEMMILGFADRTIPLQTMTTDRNALRNAIRFAEAQHTETNLEDTAIILEEKTLLRIEERIEPNPNARVILISDGNLGPTLESLTEVRNVDFVAVGETDDNIGFIQAEVRESFTGLFENQIFASLYNASGEYREVLVELELGGSILDIKRVMVPARETAPVVFSVEEGATGIATLSLANHTDAFALDDRVLISLSPPTELKVLLVSRGNPFIEAVFAVDPRVSLEAIAPVNYTPREGFDIVLFDNAPADRIPAELPPGHYIFMNTPVPESTGFAETGAPIERPRVIDWDRIHPLTRYADFDNLVVQESRRLSLPGEGVSLVQAVETDLIAVHDSETHRILVIGFDILKSYWPLDPSFSIFFQNIIDEWARTARGMERSAYAAGAVIPIVPPREAHRATIRTPDRRNINYDLEGQPAIYLTETGRTGLYEVTFDDGIRREIPVNLFSQLESDITVHDELNIAGRTVTASASALRSRQELWPFLVLLALGVLMVEWMIYCRRTYL